MTSTDADTPVQERSWLQTVIRWKWTPLVSMMVVAVLMAGNSLWSTARGRQTQKERDSLSATVTQLAGIVATLQDQIKGLGQVPVVGPLPADVVDGKAGPIGPTGPSGPAGPKGDTGLAPFVTRVAPGDGGCVYGGIAVASDDRTAYVCDGRPGFDGAPGVGVPGPEGPAGADGRDGASIVGPQGATGPSGADGATGPQGPPGSTPTRLDCTPPDAIDPPRSPWHCVVVG